tara:strand:+ start:2083 stop:2868 length:786 start_codon:yes stop_codon:yes gene_type:complete
MTSPIHLTGCLPRTTICGDGTYPIFGVPGGGSPLVLPENRWQEYHDSGVNLDQYVWEVMYQRLNSCTCDATVGGALILRARAGLDNVMLSPASIYALINGGRDNGSSLDDALHQISETGIASADVIDKYDWTGYRRRRWPSNWKEDAARNKAINAYDCSSMKHTISAVLLRFPVVAGVRWSGGGGHAILLVDYNPTRRKFKILNSWDKSWGDGGFGELPYRQVEHGMGIYGNFAMQLMTDPTNDGDIARSAIGKPMVAHAV